MSSDIFVLVQELNKERIFRVHFKSKFFKEMRFEFRIMVEKMGGPNPSKYVRFKSLDDGQELLDLGSINEIDRFISLLEQVKRIVEETPINDNWVNHEEEK